MRTQRRPRLKRSAICFSEKTRLDQQRAELFQKALDEAQSERDRIICTARKDSQEIRARRARAMKQEYQDLNQTVARLVSAEVLAITRKVLADLANTPLKHIWWKYLSSGCASSAGKKKRSSLRRSGSPSNPQAQPQTKRSCQGSQFEAFELSLPQRAAIESRFEEISAQCSSGPGYNSFWTVPDLISGIELIVDGYKLAWSAGDYLASLEKEIGAAIRSHLQYRF